MISIHDGVKDKLSSLAIEHFVNKYGIPLSKDTSKSKIHINYGKIETKQNGFVIRIIENSVKDSIVGWLETKTFKAPLFENASKVSGGKKLASFSRRGKEQPCAVLKDDEIIIGFDVFREIGHMLSGHLDNIWKTMSHKEKEHIAGIPVLDCYERILFDSIVLASKNTGIPFIQKDFWPDGKKFAVCLTHDVDELRKTYQYLTRPLKLVKKGDFKGVAGQAASIVHKIRGNEPYWTFEDLIEIEKRNDVKSTFFFLKETAKVNILKPKTWKHHGRRYDFKHAKVSKIMKKLHAGGWEVGLHGSYNSFNDPKKLKTEKSELESALGEKVTGTRQHNLKLDAPETWVYQEKIGLIYDSTLGYNDFIGFRWGTSSPFYPINPNNMEKMSLLEIPLSVMDINLFSLKNSWKELLRIEGLVEKNSGVLTLLWHHTVFNDREYPEWGSTYENIISYCKKRGGWLTTGSEISKWWKKRGENMISCDFDKGKLKISSHPHNTNHYLRITTFGRMRIKFSSGRYEIIEKDKNSTVIKTKGNLEMLLG